MANDDQSPSASAMAKLQFDGDAEVGWGRVMSMPRTWESGCSAAKAMAQTPVPQPMSTTRWSGDFGKGALYKP